MNQNSHLLVGTTTRKGFLLASTRNKLTLSTGSTDRKNGCKGRG